MFVEWSTVPATSESGGAWLIYALLDPRDLRVRYVGMTRSSLDERLAGHRKQPTNKAMRRWFRDLTEAGKEPVARLLSAPRDRWEDAERGWIAWFRQRGELLNVDPGGNCRKAGGAPIASKMRPPAPWNAKGRHGKRSHRPKKNDPWSHVRKTAAAKVAEVSRRQMQNA